MNDDAQVIASFTHPQLADEARFQVERFLPVIVYICQTVVSGHPRTFASIASGG